MYGLIGAVLFFAALTLWEVVNLRKKLDYRLGVLQRQLNKIAAHLNVELNEDVPTGLLELIQEGRKIEAIKLYREQTGAGLAEAKEAVERIQAGAGSRTDG